MELNIQVYHHCLPLQNMSSECRLNCLRERYRVETPYWSAFPLYPDDTDDEILSLPHHVQIEVQLEVGSPAALRSRQGS